MKVTRAIVILMVLMIACTGCTRRNNNTNNNASEPDLIPDIVSDVEDGMDDLKSDVEEGISRVEDDLDLDMSDGEYSDEDGILNDNSDLDDMDGNESSDVLDESIVDESVAAAMSTDFSQIGALNSEKMGWGSGGPTDDKGRPDGSTVFQERYGDLGAYFIAPESEKIYLTFDVGYENNYTVQLLDTLKEKDATAVFFVTYPYAETEQELVRRMINEGHVVGNHSTKHKSFPDLPLEEAANDIMQLHDYMLETYHYEMTLFRPPMGEFSEQTLSLLDSLGYKSVFWSFAYVDWELDNQPLTVEALNTVTSKCHPGAIYLLHAVSKTNSEILGDFIDQVRNDGYVIADWDLG